MKNKLNSDYLFLVFVLALIAWYIGQPWIIGVLALVWVGEIFNLH